MAATDYGRAQLGRPELERWLCAEHSRPTAADIATLLGEANELRPSQEQSLRFVLAVLRDIYPDDATVWRWLCEPHGDLGDAPPADLIRADRAAPLESLVVAKWNETVADAAL
jgi:hypothetical protein